MISNTPNLTDRGKSLLMRAIAGEAVTFTRFKVGDGRLPEGETGDGLNDLVHPLVVFPIKDMDSSQEGLVALTGEFDSDNVEADFYWREMGIYAKGEDDEEVLYAYANDGENAGMLRALNTEILTEQTVTLIVAIGEAEHVTAVFSPRRQYAFKSDFDQHINNKENPHGVTKEQIGLDKVPNLAPSDMTITFTEANKAENLTNGETLKVLFGKVAKAVRQIIDHIADKKNPHGVTLKDLGGAKESHEHSADDVTSGVLPLERGGTGVGNLLDLKKLIGTNAVMSIYAGDGTVKRKIPLDFRPSAVILCNSGGMMGDSVKGVCGGVALGDYGLRSPASTLSTHATTWNDDYTALLIEDDGFLVNFHEGETPEELIATNASGETYYYIAFR